MENFINENKSSLIQIYITSRLSRGEGVLMIVKTKGQEKVNVMFMTLEEIDIPLREQLLKLKEENPQENKIYFYLCEDEQNAQLVQIDL